MGNETSGHRGVPARMAAVVAVAVVVAVGSLLAGCSKSDQASTASAPAGAARPEASPSTTVPSGGAGAGGSSALDAPPAETGRKVVSSATLKVGTDE